MNRIVKQSTQWKEMQKRRDQKSFRRKYRSKEKKRLARKALQGINETVQKEINNRKKLELNFVDYKWITAPVDFSLINNPEETLIFISEIDEYYKKRKKVFINLSKVKTIGHGAIVVLLAKMVQFKSNNIKFNGNFPKDESIQQILKESGFFKNLFKEFEIQDSYDLSSANNSIYTHAQKNVNPELSDEIIRNASKLIWGSERRCLGLQRVFLELMQNTNNHATIGKSGEKHWWASVNYKKEENKVCFSFIDFGVGIFESLSNKKSDSKFYGVIDKVKNLFSKSDNAELLKLLLNGEIHQTATGKYYRGKGLPGVFEANVKNNISNLIIISNDAYANPAIDFYKLLNKNLSGVFIYWELNEQNKNLK